MNAKQCLLSELRVLGKIVTEIKIGSVRTGKNRNSTHRADPRRGTANLGS